MGLDMYAFSVPQGTGSDFGVPEGAKWKEIAYWRNFDELHDWMEDLARDKGFRGEFNCIPVLLTPAKSTEEATPAAETGEESPAAEEPAAEESSAEEEVTPEPVS